jgi:hypothetical protein
MAKRTNSKVSKYEEILTQIANWEMPYDKYGYDWGYLGEKAYICSLANHALHGTPINFQKKTEFKIHEAFHKMSANLLA